MDLPHEVSALAQDFFPLTTLLTFPSSPHVFHLIEQPIEGICSVGPWPVSATCFMASNRSRRAPGIGVVRDASSRPRYCNSSCPLKPKKSGVHWAP